MNTFWTTLTLLVSSTFAIASGTNVSGHRPLFPRASPLDGAVSYFGGPVISHVRVYNVFWNRTLPPDLEVALNDFYQGLVSGPFMDLLAEYQTNIKAVDGREGTDQTISRGTFGGSIILTPQNTNTSLIQADIETEIEYQISAGVLPKPNSDSLFMIHFPESINISLSWGQSGVDWFADHEIYRSQKYGAVAYAMMPCDVTLQSLDALTVYASHEFAEAVTDPQCMPATEAIAYPVGWIRSGLGFYGGYEIADMCQGKTASFQYDGYFYSVQQIWSNQANQCVSPASN